MWSLLGFAVMLGMHHAMEPDHVAAVSSLAANRRRLPDVISHGLTWGLGHAFSLLLFAGLAMVLGKSIPPSYSTALDGVVGIMLLGLGFHVLWRIWHERIHFHAHSHGDGTTHFHAHSHANSPKVDPSTHRYVLHEHDHSFKWRSLLVGMTHGLSGSGALLVLAASKVDGVAMGLGYVVMFGLGSIAGMGLMSAAVSVPLVLSARFMTFANRWFQAAVGLFTVSIGASIFWSAIG